MLTRFGGATGDSSKSNFYSNVKGHITSANCSWLQRDLESDFDGRANKTVAMRSI
jgi:hypothetical protein